MDGRGKDGNKKMGKDIDRNITRQLWERLKNTFSKNDVIPIKNGGTGGDLDSFYPKLVSDTQLLELQKHSLPLLDGFHYLDTHTAYILLNKKSMFIAGVIDIARDSNITSDEFLNYKIAQGGYNIQHIRISTNGFYMSINDDILSLSGHFASNVFHLNVNVFVPFI